MTMLECLSLPAALSPIATLLLCFAGASAAPPGPAALEAAREDAVKKCDTVQAQLQLATELRNALRGLEGPERDAARARALAACRAVRQHFPNEGAACAE